MTNVRQVGTLVTLATGILLTGGRGRGAGEPDFVSELNRARQVVAEDTAAKAFYDGPFNKAFYAQYSVG